MTAFLYELTEGLRIALRSIWANKLRAMLTTLGIIIGIVSVTAMFTTINGIERGFDRSVAMLGTNVLNVERFPNTMEGGWWRYANRPVLREDIAEVIEQQSRSAAAVAPVVYGSERMRYGDRQLGSVLTRASTPALVEVSGLDLAEGRFFNESDERSGRYVVVIGQEVAEELFPGEAAVGKYVRMRNDRFEVIGVLVRQGKFLGLVSLDNQAVVPLGAFRKAFGLSPQRDMTIQVKVADGVPLEAAEDELIGIVRAARAQDPIEEENFAINRQDAFRQQIAGVKLTIYAIGLFLTALALLVGGIGVMNIMFVSVRERTREIGIRKAVGATKRAILVQFLLEAVIVCLIGGVIGVALATGVTALINQVFTAYLSPTTVALAFGICVGIGVLFGFIPAWSAARSRPIDALRYE